HPGKKLLFMGGEFGQEREWNHDRSLDWHLLGDTLHGGVQSAVRDLNRLYRETPALHARDADPSGFEWLDATNSDESVYSYIRHGGPDDPPVLVVCNFTPVVRHAYRIGAPRAGRWVEKFNSDAAAYGGSNVGNGGAVMAEASGWQGRPASLSLTVPPLATSIFEHAG
ncbi:MAG: alpha amylase C-terminal domain-containing protein, partial [Pseudomonadota bacterium]|nr:alpha amylase C-terminal domain-containing protein [Pseudomonadota bacterium]